MFVTESKRTCKRSKTNTLLQYAVTFFGHCGIQLHHYSIHVPRTWITLSITLLSLVSFFHTFVLVDRSQQKAEFFRKYKDQPLFRQFVYMNSTFGYVPNIISNLIYYLFNGPKMVDCLRESYELNRTYHRYIGERKGIRIILSYWSNEFMQSIFTAISCHLISITDYFPLHSLFYGEWLIRRTLLDFRDHHLLHITDERRFIQTLALTSERFHWLQSLPLLMFCTNNSIQLTIFICVNFLSREHYFNAKGFCLIAYFLFINLYTVYIVNINEQSLTIFDDIMTQLRARKHRIRIRLIQSSTNMIGTYELEQYRNCFRLKLFYLTYLNINVLFTMALTIVGLAVFILQTN